MKLKPGMKCFRKDGLPFDGYGNFSKKFGIIKFIFKEQNQVFYDPTGWDSLDDWNKHYMVLTKLYSLFYVD